MSQKDIAAAIGVSPSTITRELKRNCGSRSKYNWKTAQSNATYHKHRRPGNHAVKAEIKGKRLGITVFQPRLKVCTFARTNYYEYGKQRQVQESP